MPLVTKIVRNGKTHKPEGGWDDFSLSCFYTAAYVEAAPDRIINDMDEKKLTYGDLVDGQWVDFSMSPIYYMDGCPLVEEGEQKLERAHFFRATYRDGTERTLKFNKGDILKAWREHKH